MLAELRTKSQITLPKDIVSSLGLSEGDKLDIYEQNGMICIVPMTCYPKKYVNDLQSEIVSLKEALKSGKKPAINKIDELLDKLQDSN